MTIEKTNIPPRDRCNAATLRKASRRVTHLFDIALSPIGLKTTQFSLLAEIARRAPEEPTVSELAEVLVMDRSTLGQNLLPLERAHLISIRRNPADRRSRVISLTQEGQHKLVAGLPLWSAVQAEFEAVIGKGKAEQLRRLLTEVVEDPHFLPTLRSA